MKSGIRVAALLQCVNRYRGESVSRLEQ